MKGQDIYADLSQDLVSGLQATGFMDFAPLLHAAAIWNLANVATVPNVADHLIQTAGQQGNPMRIRLLVMGLRAHFQQLQNVNQPKPRQRENELEQLSGTPVAKKGPGGADLVETPPPSAGQRQEDEMPRLAINVEAEDEREEVDALGRSESDEELRNMITNKLPPCPECSNDHVHTLILQHDFFHPKCGGFIGRKTYGCGALLDRVFDRAVEVWRYGPTDEDPKRGWFRIETTDRKPNGQGGKCYVRRWSCRLTLGCPATIVQTFPDGRVEEACVKRFLIGERWIGHHNHGVDCKTALVLKQDEESRFRFQAGGSVLDSFIKATATEEGARLQPSMKHLEYLKSRVVLDSVKESDTELLKGIAAHAASKAVDGVGVLECLAGVVDKRAAFMTVIGGHVKMLQKWVADCSAVWRKLGLHGSVRLDCFVDGQWGWGNLGRTFQVLQITLPHPGSKRGYATYMVVMDVKSAHDYAEALAPFLRMLAEALAASRLDMSAMRFHCDEEAALISALEATGGDIIGCRFHKIQNLTAQIKGNFPKRINGATGTIKGFSAATRTFLSRTIVAFYHHWTSTSKSEEDALSMLRREAMQFLDAGTVAAHKPSFASDLQAALEAGGEQEADLSDVDLGALIERICDCIQFVFDYLEHNVYPVASRHFRYALGDEVYDEMGTNNLSEAQNSRFDKFVGLSTSVKSILALVKLCITYLRSAGHTYMADKGVPRKKQGNKGAAARGDRDISVRMQGWSLGATFQSMRRGPRGAAVLEELDPELVAALASDESGESDE